MTITYVIFLIFTGTAVLATLALYTRQSLLVAYIALGAILGPYGLQLVVNAEVIQQAGDIGIIFLLFLLGLHLQPQSVVHSLRKMSVITLSSSLFFFVLGFLIAYYYGFGMNAAIPAMARLASVVRPISTSPRTKMPCRLTHTSISPGSHHKAAVSPCWKR